MTYENYCSTYRLGGLRREDMVAVQEIVKMNAGTVVPVIGSRLADCGNSPSRAATRRGYLATRCSYINGLGLFWRLASVV